MTGIGNEGFQRASKALGQVIHRDELCDWYHEHKIAIIAALNHAVDDPTGLLNLNHQQGEKIAKLEAALDKLTNIAILVSENTCPGLYRVNQQAIETLKAHRGQT